MAFRQTNLCLVPLTKAVVARFHGMPTTKGDRDVATPQGQRRTRWLKSKMETGRFFSPVWATATVNGHTYRMNGAHSSGMLLEVDTERLSNMQAVLYEFECDTMQDLADLFDQWDARRSLRTRHDKLKYHGAVEERLNAVTPTTLNCAIEGLAFYFNACKDVDRLEEDERIQLIHEHIDFILWVKHFVGRRLLKRVGTQAAMYATWLLCPKCGEAFWRMVGEEDHPDPSHPTRKLASFHRDSFGTHNLVSPPWWFYVKAVHAWNAAIENRPSTLRVVTTAAKLPAMKKPHGRDHVCVFKFDV